MSKKKRFGVSQALTRGLTETINVVENNAGLFRNVVLPLSRIELDPENPRKMAITLTDMRQGLNKNDPLYTKKLEEYERLVEMSATIESSGVINPIVVYKRGDIYRVVAGERRCLASILAGKNEIDARVFNEKPKGFELKLIQWIENTAREDLTLNERVGNIEDLLREYQQQNGEAHITATLLKDLTGLSLPQSTYYLAVMNSEDDLKSYIKKGQIKSLDKAAIIAGVDDESLRQTAIRACVNGCSLKELRRIVSDDKHLMKEIPHKKTERRGRLLKRINLGTTQNLKAVRTIVESVLLRDEYKHFAHLFTQIKWDQLEQVNEAFKRLIHFLDKNEK